jgi:hypothetical protein
VKRVHGREHAPGQLKKKHVHPADGGASHAQGHTGNGHAYGHLKKHVHEHGTSKGKAKAKGHGHLRQGEHKARK